jgi:excisionase family DNA binding protein
VSARRELPTARLWTAEQAASYLGVRPSWVYEATREGRIPVVRLGKHVRYLQEDLDEWIAEHRIEARPWKPTSTLHFRELAREEVQR